MSYFSRAVLLALVLSVPVAQAQDPLIDKLKNATYRCGKQAIKLKNGYREHSVSGGFTQLDESKIALGAPGASSGLAAVVVLGHNGGGNAMVNELHAVRLVKGVPQDVAAMSLGGGGVKSIGLQDGEVRVTTLTFGPDDPHCCPSVTKTQVLRVSGSRFVPVLSNEEVTDLLQNYESASSSLAAVEITMSTDPQAVYAFSQLSEQAKRFKVAQKEALKLITKADLLSDPRFKAAVRDRISEQQRVYEGASIGFGQAPPGQQRAILVVGQVVESLKRLLRK
ncbi:hypothetical protein [Geothrix paludis]|uniref:hypothetical protein n=1 Tax=Geothrix paludis TaxID=2922722 RepID=UPI001FADEE70|nr:hypothetical protein [Geothrix paludis]